MIRPEYETTKDGEWNVVEIFADVRTVRFSHKSQGTAEKVCGELKRASRLAQILKDEEGQRADIVALVVPQMEARLANVSTALPYGSGLYSQSPFGHIRQLGGDGSG